MMNDPICVDKPTPATGRQLDPQTSTPRRNKARQIANLCQTLHRNLCETGCTQIVTRSAPLRPTACDPGRCPHNAPTRVQHVVYDPPGRYIKHPDIGAGINGQRANKPKLPRAVRRMARCIVNHDTPPPHPVRLAQQPMLPPHTPLLFSVCVPPHHLPCLHMHLIFVLLSPLCITNDFITMMPLALAFLTLYSHDAHTFSRFSFP